MSLSTIFPSILFSIVVNFMKFLMGWEAITEEIINLNLGA